MGGRGGGGVGADGCWLCVLERGGIAVGWGGGVYTDDCWLCGLMGGGLAVGQCGDDSVVWV